MPGCGPGEGCSVGGGFRSRIINSGLANTAHTNR